MKITSRKPKSKWHSPTFTVAGIDRETLALILEFAADGIAYYIGSRTGDGETSSDSYADLRETIKNIDDYVNSDETTRLTPLELK